MMSGNTRMVGDGKGEMDRMAVKISHLDSLLGLTGEIIIAASNLSILQRHITANAHKIDKETADMVGMAVMSTNRISSDLHHLVMDIRLVPIRDTFLRFRRLVRDIAKKRGRQVDFEIVGEDTLVDKTVAEKLYEPLAHQIRNAIDHGLEDPLERKAAGKNPTGRLTLTAFNKEGFSYVSVADDGKGLNVQRIREVAVEKRLLTPAAAQAASTEECYALIMHPGFSTNKEATEISGRGVGMDVVKNVIGDMGGEVQIESTPGKGSMFTYKVPQLSAVNITDALVIRAGDSHFAIPIGNVVATHAYSPSEINTAFGSNENIIYLKSILPLYDLRALLSGVPIEEHQETIPIIIIEAKNGRIALKVSAFLRPQKLVLIPLPDLFPLRGISGTTILGGSQLGMIVDPFQLINMALGRSDDDGESYLARNSAMTFEEESPQRAAADAPSAAVAGTTTGGPLSPEKETELDEAVAEEFFVEIQEILKDLTEDIFQLEKSPTNMGRVNTIFRHIHSIKGNFIMTGFTKAGAFVHNLETVLDRIRDKELTANQEIIDLLLDAAKNIESGLALIRAGKPYEISDSELLATLSKYRRRETMIAAKTEADPADATFNLSPLGMLQFHAKMLIHGENVYQSMIHLKPSFQEPALVAYLIIRRLTYIGDIIDSVPSVDRLERGLIGDKFKVMFSSKQGPEDVNRFFNRQIEKHFAIEGFEILQME